MPGTPALQKRTPGFRPDDVRYLPLAEPASFITSPADPATKGGLYTVTRAVSNLVPPRAIISRFASGHGWTGGTSDDTTNKLFTDRSYLTTTNGAGGSKYAGSPTFTAQDWSSSIIRLIFRVDDPTKLNILALNVTTSGGGVYSSGILHNAIAGEWCVVTMCRQQFSVATGSPSWASVTQVSVRIADKSTGAVNVNLAAVELIPDLSALYPYGVFIMEADDGFIGQKTYLAPVVGQRGVPVTYNGITDHFISGNVYNSGITVADLQAWQDKWGWQMSCHAYDSPTHGNTTATAAQLEATFQRQKQWLHANGLHSGADHYALCPGTGSPLAAGPVFDAVRRSFRSVRVNSAYYETSSPADPLRLRSTLFSGSGNNVTAVKANIDAVAGAGGAFIFTVHDVIAGATDGTSNGLAAIAQTNLATILDYAASKGMTFRTRADWLDGR